MNLLQSLNEILSGLPVLGAESVLIIGAIILLVVGLFTESAIAIKSVFVLSIGLAIIALMQLKSIGETLHGSVTVSGETISFSALFLVAGLCMLVFKRASKHASEFYFLVLAILVGALFVTQASNLLIAYISIELLSFASYVLTNFAFKKTSYEASIKYLLFGAMCSAFMLLGVGFLYGATQSIDFSSWQVYPGFDSLYQVGLVLFLVGVFFKISIAPLHIWVPATYQTAPVDATALLSVVPKLAALLFLRQFVLSEAVGFESLSWLMNLLYILGILTMLAGTLGAFRQQHVRRMISFGAIAHSGFLLPFALINTSASSEAFWWYSVTYIVMNYGAFYLVGLFEEKGQFLIEEYSSRDFWVVVPLIIVLISLVGIPPAAGFTAKFFLFSTLWEQYEMTQSSMVFSYLMVATLVTVGALFFYFKIPKKLLLTTAVKDASFGIFPRIVATLFSFLLLLLFFAPQYLSALKQILFRSYE